MVIFVLYLLFGMLFGLLPKRRSADLLLLGQIVVGPLYVAAVALVVDAARRGARLSFSELFARVMSHARRLIITSIGYFLLLFPVAIIGGTTDRAFTRFVSAGGYDVNWLDSTVLFIEIVVFFVFPSSFVCLAAVLAFAHIVLGDEDLRASFRGIDALRNPNGYFVTAGIVGFVPAAVLFVFATIRVINVPSAGPGLDRHARGPSDHCVVHYIRHFGVPRYRREDAWLGKRRFRNGLRSG